MEMVKCYAVGEKPVRVATTEGHIFNITPEGTEVPKAYVPLVIKSNCVAGSSKAEGKEKGEQKEVETADKKPNADGKKTDNAKK